MEVKQVAALPERLEVTDIEMVDGVLTIMAVSIQAHPACPLCGEPATRVHSYYTRKVADLPCSGRQVRLFIHVRKCFCDAPDCTRKIFVERLTPFVNTFARVTQRLYQIVQIIGLATGGRLGVRVTDRLEIQTSRHTILRRIMALPTEPVGAVSQIGIDDFAFRRGRKFGTIIVDLRTHKVLDVLPDRTADTSAAWLATHPEIEVVSRDRGGDYAAAARKAFPEATQTADRFHVLKNLGKALEGVLSRHLAAHRRGQAEKSRATPLETTQPVKPLKSSPKAAALSQAKREERLATYEQVVALRKQGFSQTAIANQVGIGHATVSRWLRSDAFPQQPPRPRKSRLDPYLKEVSKRWEAGCHNIAQLHRELVASGVPLTYKVVYKQLVRYLPEGRKNAQRPDQLPRPPVLARQAAFLFLRRPSELEADEQETLALLQSLHTEVKQTYELVQQFAQMLRTRTGEQLDDWLERVKASKIRELQGFVTGVERDKAAVLAGLTLPQNNDHVA
ncbi:ISL3 family transposase [Ktedonospora formicarum]|uniref:ISL3 family transposase n=1 Tax=Ktedonospora formicarum TaxID=2778364 RepID=A0A8J3MTV2_9CHLR|nr:ISL3 family transposase [Ktedonospora formicarum]GHO47545.1 ISL3 family transposase [Ktedonospora formicarum]